MKVRKKKEARSKNFIEEKSLHDNEAFKQKPFVKKLIENNSEKAVKGDKAGRKPSPSPASSALKALIQENSDTLDENNGFIVIVMAAGSGSRIKSSFPKVMHELWGVPSVLRVLDAASKALKTANQIVVVGKQAEALVSALGKKKHRLYAYQKEQKGTGHAVQVALASIPPSYKGKLCIIPGDMGLIDAETLTAFYEAQSQSKCKMMMFTGEFVGNIEENYFGRVVRVPEKIKQQAAHVVSIKQYKDLLGLQERGIASIDIPYRDSSYTFSVEELLALREFDSGVFIFSISALRENILKIKNENIQKEIYLTDLVDIYNKNNLSVESFSASRSEFLLGFNDKSMWRRMQDVFRQRCFYKLRNIVDFEDQTRFFIHEKIMQRIVEDDKTKSPLDIHIGSGASIGEEAFFESQVYFGDNVVISGNVSLGKNVRLEKNIHFSTIGDQKIIVKDNVSLRGSNIIRGNVLIEEGAIVDSHVNITGSDAYPTKIGRKSYIQGTSYIFGCTIAPESKIVTSILYKKKVSARLAKDGRVQAVRYVLPRPEGLENLSDL